MPAAQSATPSLAARWIAVAVALVAVTVLCGWGLSVPPLRSVLPGAVEMKVNTAIALLLAAFSLFLHGRESSALSRSVATAAAAIVAAIGLVTLSEYVFGWHAGIDDLLFKDPGRAFDKIPGRMSPFSAVAFIAIGVAIAAIGRRGLGAIVLVSALVTTTIGLISLLGYIWDARELTTDQWIPPVAIHTALAFLLLSIGTGLAARHRGKATATVPKQSRGRVEAKVLIGFGLALALFCVGGGITYHMQANQSRSGQLLVDTQQARTALGGTYAAIADAQSDELNYLITGNRQFRDQFLLTVRKVAAQLEQLATSARDRSAEQRASWQYLQELTARRMNSLTHNIDIFDHGGEAAARQSIGADNGAQTMQELRESVATLDAREAALAQGYAQQLTRDRSYTLVAMLSTLMMATATLLVLFVSIVRDIAERAQITAALARAQQEAQKANEAKSQFLAAMSHEIRTPMNGVVGMVELLEQSSLLEPQMQMVQLIRESAHALLTIINDILDFSKIEAGRFEIAKVPLSLREVIEGSCSLLNRLAERQKTTLTVFCDPAIPAQLIGDDMRVRQVIVNLTHNALKFSSGLAQPGRVAVRATLLEQSPSRALVEVRVIDNGIGMDRATQERLFTPFMQSDASTTRRYGGTGLGLVISKQLIELMGGSVEVATAPGSGSTFTLRLPFELPPAEAPPVLQQQPLADLPCLVVGGPGGLADDLASYLGSEGAAVGRVAELGAAEAWSRARPNCLAVWVVEAGEDPYALEPQLRALRQQCPSDVRVVMVVVGRDQRQAHAQVEGFVVVDGNALSRDTLVGAVGAAAGRMRNLPATRDGHHRGATPAPATRAQACRDRRLILVAEDNEINQRLIREQLSLLGYTADIVANGREALRCWHTGDYALMFIDLHMPEMDGYDLTLAVRLAESKGRGAHIPIIALTANALSGEPERCRSAGMDDYLTKPASLKTLDATVARWLPGARPQLAGESARAPVDVGVLEDLIGSDRTVVRSFLDHFAKSADQAADELIAACNAEQPRLAAAVAHKLKSAAYSVGAARLGTLCVDIEAAGNDNATARLQSLLPAFEAELRSVQEYLQSNSVPDDNAARRA
jgi:signal transduction histidine kinase/CheY-like chemotaxis protein